MTRPEHWPLISGGVTANLLRRFAPVGFGALAQARSLGFLHDAELRKIVTEEISRTAPALMIFLSTAHIFNRELDIRDELNRLAHDDDPEAEPLWVVLSRIIVDEYDDPDEIVRMLEGPLSMVRLAAGVASVHAVRVGRRVRRGDDGRAGSQLQGGSGRPPDPSDSRTAETQTRDRRACFRNVGRQNRPRRRRPRDRSPA